jgi:hypothetical protein
LCRFSLEEKLFSEFKLVRELSIDGKHVGIIDEFSPGFEEWEEKIDFYQSAKFK